ncbi:phytoene/squalene synthase family protein [Niabella yanshanensis]|uniref:Phytoene/squalene synthase family protein n=1 Tax=Niabella yanshanensis TaxID=577386 RepID=A0ABZ0W6P1_9BACT|nr:phytoene/squalene synthase family protein [Niabella yanshanensis]WQD38263.1 phytoene/squalene synthase family protein [Niabella yanshanensis]
MKKIFDDLSYHVSKHTTHRYSTSFSMGIFALQPAIRPAIYAIYGFVRLADEIVDSFHDYNKSLLLGRFKEQATQAINEGISINPIINAFQQTVKRYNIDIALIDQFLLSMEMDLEQVSYNSELYKQYILGSAEVVGLMCLQVFVNGDARQYEQLKPQAMKLGSVFQKVNFLRDLKDDYHNLGRTYFPDIEMQVFNNTIKNQIEEEIAAEFKEALAGILKLPRSSRFGVYLAYKYYWSLFEKIRKTPAERILKERIRIPNGRKLSLAMSSYFQYKLAWL